MIVEMHSGLLQQGARLEVEGKAGEEVSAGEEVLAEEEALAEGEVSAGEELVLVGEEVQHKIFSSGKPLMVFKVILGKM